MVGDRLMDAAEIAVFNSQPDQSGGEGLGHGEELRERGRSVSVEIAFVEDGIARDDQEGDGFAGLEKTVEVLTHAVAVEGPPRKIHLFGGVVERERKAAPAQIPAGIMAEITDVCVSVSYDALDRRGAGDGRPHDQKDQNGGRRHAGHDRELFPGAFFHADPRSL